MNFANMRLRRHAQEARELWQGRLLLEARGRMGAVVLSVIAHNFPQAVPVLMLVCFGSQIIQAPFLASAGRVVKSGHVVADVMEVDGSIVRNAELFKDKNDMIKQFRDLADKLRFNDAVRESMFIAVKRWLVADYRINPNTGEVEHE